MRGEGRRTNTGGRKDVNFNECPHVMFRRDNQKKKKKTHIKLCCVLFKDYSAASLMKKGKRGEIQGKRESPRPSTNDPKIQPRGAFICCERGLGGFKPRPAGFSSCCWKGLRCRALPEKGFAINRDWIQLASCKTDC